MKIDKEFTAINADGNEILCTVLLTFENFRNGKHYVIYTDHSVDAAGNKTLLASIYSPDPEDLKLYPIETEEEWREIADICRQQLNLSE